MDKKTGSSKYDKAALEKVAILMLYLEGRKPEAARNFFKSVGEEKSRVILAAMSSLGQVDQQVVDATLKDFLKFLVQKKSIIGGYHLSSKIFQDVYGESLPEEDEHKVASFDCLKSATDAQIMALFSQSSVPFQAFVLSQLSQSKMSAIISNLPADHMQVLLKQLSTLNPQLGNRWLLKLEKKIGLFFSEVEPRKNADDSTVQVQKIAVILEQTPISKRREIMDKMLLESPEIVRAVENLMIRFSDLFLLPSKMIQKIVGEVDSKILATAMTGIDSEIEALILGNLSGRLKNVLIEFKNSLGAPTEAEIEESQLAVVSVARDLETRGLISLAGLKGNSNGI